MCPSLSRKGLGFLYVHEGKGTCRRMQLWWWKKTLCARGAGRIKINHITRWRGGYVSSFQAPLLFVSMCSNSFGWGIIIGESDGHSRGVNCWGEVGISDICCCVRQSRRDWKRNREVISWSGNSGIIGWQTSTGVLLGRHIFIYYDSTIKRTIQ